VIAATGALLSQALHLAAMLAAAPLLAGLLRTAAARFAGRPGPHPLLPWRDLRKLLRKRPVAAEGGSVVSFAAPHAAVSATVLAAALVPSFALGMLSAPLAELLLLIGLLALARLGRALAAIDAGGALGGLDAARGLARSLLAEAAALLAAMSLAAFAGTTALEGIIGAVRERMATGAPRLLPFGVAALVLAGVALVEVRGLRGGSPAAGGEPELGAGGLAAAAPRDASGRHLALWEFQAALRLTVWLSLLAALILPIGLAPAGAGPLAWAAGALAWAGKLLVLGLVLALAEAALARLPPARAPELLGATLLVALLGVVLTVATGARL
jgi:formate hydrogenlyase subunit 4